MTRMEWRVILFLVTAASCSAHRRQYTAQQVTQLTGFGAPPGSIKSSELPQQDLSTHFGMQEDSQHTTSGVVLIRKVRSAESHTTTDHQNSSVSLDEAAVSPSSTGGDMSSSLSTGVFNISEEFLANSTERESGGGVDPQPEMVVEPCSEEVAGHYTCHTAQAFYKLAAEGPRKENVSVSIRRVDGELSLEPLTNLTLIEISLAHANITSFTHQRQDLTLLRKLDLTDNPDLVISSLGRLGKVPALTQLSLRGADLSASGPRLQEVLQQFPGLQHLDLTSTRLTTFNSSFFRHNMNLTKLLVAENEFNNITLEDGLLRRLTSLNLTGCGLREVRVVQSPTRVDLDPVPLAPKRRRYLSLAHNFLTHLPPQLINIVAANNAHLNITGNLWHESCSKCGLYDLWRYWRDNPHLVEGGEDLGCFRQDEALASCGWQDCPVGCTCYEDTKLVDCSNAGLRTIPTVCPAGTETLLLQNNNLTDLSGINSLALCNLRTLNVQGNHLRTLVPEGVTGHCSCYDDEIFYSEERTCFPQGLKALDLSHNNLKHFTDRDCKLLYSLETLKLSYNNMEAPRTRVCGPLMQLENLTMDHNKLNSLMVQDLAVYPSLRQLNLAYNNLVTFPTTITRLMPDLRILDVSHNSLNSFSGEASTPQSPFASLVVSRLEVLRLNHNKFSQIVPVFDLKDLSTLKKLTLTHNKWSCYCDSLNSLPDRVMAQLNNPALIQALAVVECYLPHHLKGRTFNDFTIPSECPAEQNDSMFLQMVASLIMAFSCILILYNVYKGVTKVTAPLHTIDATLKRKYDVLVVHAHADYDLVKTVIIGPLVSLGYSVAWHDNAFQPGEWFVVSVEQAVTNSRRMLVMCTDNLLGSRTAIPEIRRGLHEQLEVPGFKVSAIVMDSLPKVLPLDIYQLVVDRTHIVHRNSDYLKKLKDFLPTPRRQPDVDHCSEICTRLEELRRRKNQAHTPLSEVFGIVLNPTHVTINVDIPNNDSLTDEDYKRMVNRFATRPALAFPNQPHTISTEYELVAMGNEEEVAQIEGFVRDLSTRRTCKF